MLLAALARLFQLLATSLAEAFSHLRTILNHGLQLALDRFLVLGYFETVQYHDQCDYWQLGSESPLAAAVGPN